MFNMKFKNCDILVIIKQKTKKIITFQYQNTKQNSDLQLELLLHISKILFETFIYDCKSFKTRNKPNYLNNNKIKTLFKKLFHNK